MHQCESVYVLLSSVAKEDRVVGSPLVCCVDLAGTAGWGCPASLLMSPVGFDSFDIAHQILSKADTKDLETNATGGRGQVGCYGYRKITVMMLLLKKNKKHRRLL